MPPLGPLLGTSRLWCAPPVCPTPFDPSPTTTHVGRMLSLSCYTSTIPSGQGSRPLTQALSRLSDSYRFVELEAHLLTWALLVPPWLGI